MLKYWRAAFLYRWNLLFFLGGAIGAVLSPWPDAALPIVGALEIAYLTGLTSMPRFRKAIDAGEASIVRNAAAGPVNAQDSLNQMLESLPALSLRRFLLLRQRCFEMRDIASGVQGRMAGNSDAQSADSIRTPALDKLLFLFLKLLMSQSGLERFLRSTSEPELATRLEAVKAKLAEAGAANDERVMRSLQDSLADAQLRLDNYQKSAKDLEFVGVELDRIETKIKALIEMGVSRQDPDVFSTQVTAAAESMQQTEDAVMNLQSLSGLADQLAEPPAILNADLDRVPVRP